MKLIKNAQGKHSFLWYARLCLLAGLFFVGNIALASHSAADESRSILDGNGFRLFPGVCVSSLAMRGIGGGDGWYVCVNRTQTKAYFFPLKTSEERAAVGNRISSNQNDPLFSYFSSGSGGSGDSGPTGYTQFEDPTGGAADTGAGTTGYGDQGEE